MEMIETIGIFFAQTFIIVVAIIAVLITIASLALKNKNKGAFEIDLLHEKYEDQTQALKEAFLTDAEIKKEHKRLKKEAKLKNKEADPKPQGRVFVVEFLNVDIKASDSENLKEEVNTILGVATADDEVVVKV